MPIYRVQAPNGKVYRVEGPENADPNILFQATQQQVDTDETKRLQKEYGPGILETFGRGVKRGAGALGSTFTDIIPAMGASALGFEDYAKEQLAEAAQKQQEREAASPTVFQSYKDVEGVGDALKFAAETIGEQVPNIATALIPGVGAAGLAARAGLGVAGKAAAVGAGTYLGSYAQSAPEIFQNVYQETGQLAPGAAAIFGAGAAALDSVLPASLARSLSGPVKASIVEKVLEKSGMDKGLLRSVTAGVVKGVPTEGLTEGAQEAIGIAAEKFVGENPQIFESKEWNRIMESAVRGAVAGGAFGGAGGGIDAAQNAAQRRAEYADALERRGDRQAAAEVRRQSAEIEAIQAQEAQMQLPGFEAGPATGLLPPAAPTEPESKSPKATQYEMFGEEGALTPAMEKAATKDEKAAVNRARLAEQRQAAQLKEDQAALKKAIAELTGVPTDLAGLAKQPSPLAQTIGQARGEMDALAAKRAPKAVSATGTTVKELSVQPTTTLVEEPQVRKPLTSQEITKLDDLKGFGKLLGIGPTARILRADGPLAGKDLTDPAQAAEVRQVLEAYASGKPAVGAAEKIDAFLKRPEFQGAPDAARPVEPTTGTSVAVAGEPGGVVAPGAVEGTEPSGMVSPREVVGEPDVGEGPQPGALTPQEEATQHPAVVLARQKAAEAEAVRAGAVDLTAERAQRKAIEQEVEPLMTRLRDAVDRGLASDADILDAQDLIKSSGSAMEAGSKMNQFLNQIEGRKRPAEPVELGKKAKSDLAKAEAGTETALKEQATFVDDVDQRTNDFLTGQLRSAARESGLEDTDVPSESYVGSDVHNMMRLPPLFNEFFRLQDVARQQGNDPAQQQKNQQEMQAVKDAIAKSGMNPDEAITALGNRPPAQRDAMLSELSRQARTAFDKETQERVAAIKAEKASQAKAEKPAKREYTEDEMYEAIAGKLNEGKVAKALGRKLFNPVYQGPTFDADLRKQAEAGDANGLLRSLLDQIKDPAIKQVLRKLRSLNLKTKLVIGPVEGGQAGSYDPATGTITLDPQNGLNAHTFIHEMVHAAISNVLASPNHPLTKDFQKFFVTIQDRLGAAYGAQDLQEFAAELVGNPSFQAVLKDIKTPRSESMFRHVMRKIAEFFGFAPKTSAFDTGLNFVERAIDISGDVKPTASEKMFLGMGNFPAIHQIGQAMPAMTRQATEQAKNIFSNLEGYDLKRMGFGLMRLDNLRNMYGDKLPSIQTLLDSLEKRNGMQERRIKDANTKYKDMVKVQKANPQAMKRLNDVAVDARIAGVDLLNPSFRPEPAQQAEYSRLKTQFNALPKDVQGVYRTIRTDYDASFNQYLNILKRAAESVSPSLATRLAEAFQTRKPVVGYVPFLRQGDFWVEYQDPQTGERAVSAFQSIRERQQFIDTMLKGQPSRTFQNIQDLRFSDDNLPPTHFIHQVINGLRQQGASQDQVDGVYQAYLATFPAESLMKQFMKSKNVAGMERDIVRGYSDLMVRWARKLSNAEFVPQIDRSLLAIQNEAQASGDQTLTAAAQNITDQAAFFHNPNFNTFVHNATALSYFEFIAGNISSALINITSLPMMVYPMLVGRHGWSNTSAAMTAAGKTAMNDWGKGKYKNLYDTLTDHAQLEHTMAREVLEGRRQTTDDFVGLKARILDGLSIPFSATEKYNRAVTAIAAYDLAKQAGMSEEKAIQQALNTVKDVHTSGLAVTGPKWMQTPMGRLFFTFKSFVWNSAYVMARAFHQAFKGEDPQIRKAAQRQLLATYGMATVFTGIKGMPFYGATSVLANMINALFGDDEEPFDYDEFLRDIFGETLFKGFFNQVTNLEIANRAGIATDLIFRDDPRGVADHGYVLSALQQAFGPIGSIAVNAGRSAELFRDGEVVRGLETIAPSFYRNFSKGMRYLTEGATTIKGDPIMEDIGVYNSLMQVVGFSPADLSSQYERTQAAKGFEREVLQRRQKLLNRYDMASTAGDMDLMQETLDQIAEFNAARPSKSITRETLLRSQRARRAAEQEAVAGVRFDKDLRPEIIDKFYDEE